VLWKVDVSQLAWLELQAGFTYNRRRQEPFVQELLWDPHSWQEFCCQPHHVQTSTEKGGVSGQNTWYTSPSYKLSACFPVHNILQTQVLPYHFKECCLFRLRTGEEWHDWMLTICVVVLPSWSVYIILPTATTAHIDHTSTDV
jgi:hypothetical protein